MEEQYRQVEEMQALQESLELQRRPVLAEILKLHDDGSGPEATEQARLKLAIINRELALIASQIIELKRRRSVSFETPEKMQIINQVLQKSISPVVKEAVKAVNEAETKVQILVARADQFEAQKDELAKEIEQLNQESRRVLYEGGDPSAINRQLRAKVQESEDLATWAAELRKGAVPEAENALTDAKNELWEQLDKLVREVRPRFDKELNDYLAQASELSASWPKVVKNLFIREYRTGRDPSIPAGNLVIDQKRTNFFKGHDGPLSPFGARL